MIPIGSLRFDSVMGMVHRDGEEVALDSRSARILLRLASEPGALVPLATLLQTAGTVSVRSLRNTICDLRKKRGSGAHHLVSVPGGYQLDL